MKKLILFSFVTLFYSVYIFSQPCFPDGVVFSTQSEIDDFPINNPECSQILGDVVIRGTDINNLEGLNLIISIGGNLLVESNDLLTNLTGLENLQNISGSLLIGNFYFGSYPYCTGNPSLTSLEGLNGLLQVEGSMKIYCNNNLSNLTGFENLTSVGGDVTIGTIDYIYGFKFGNELLENFNGLSSLSTVGGIFSIAGNNNLVHLDGLNSLNSIGGSFMIAWNDVLKDLSGVGQMTTIGGNLDIRNNDSLISLNGLDNLTQILGDLKIGGNWDGNLLLSDLNALSNLFTIGGDLEISYNATLSNLSGLNNIDPGSIENLKIRNNSSLSACEVYSICQYLASPTGTVEIQDNATGCNSAEEIMGLCDYSIVSDFNIIGDALIHPNPFSTSITIEYELKHPETVRVEFYNQFGKIVDVIEEYQRTGLNKIEWTPKNLVEGIYYIRIKACERWSTEKVILMK